jgi:predicted nucleic acid-binding protein
LIGPTGFYLYWLSGTVHDRVSRSTLLPDPNDRHVLAAAIRGQANVIVTMNLRDFPTDVHPDEFILHLLDVARDAVIAVAVAHGHS